MKAIVCDYCKKVVPKEEEPDVITLTITKIINGRKGCLVNQIDLCKTCFNATSHYWTKDN